MDVITEVGETAGKVWQLLNDQGPQTLSQLKKKLNGTGELLSFAIGWLARENKVQFAPAKNSLRIQLK